ncbi:DNA-binding GntR family transcriptional regulator [Pseudorhizobium tarimense]|uniref:DNA-binding GntR family transcriptional regulator n=1 Tax=Pseudorhizobium tarimense TaxID=1079109 RepID=A0ABV2H2D1_9HYPH|nr:GntR family transcriptional regulator [Pseudorhizobium tarimense]MCJ8517704.1 GntR family transcriptional regulator [Pseudorhizobium tarimense]
MTSAAKMEAGMAAARTQGGTVPRLYQQVFDILAAQITQGALREGARLSESALAAQFGISRAPARQALAELERQGLLAKGSGRGYQVKRQKQAQPSTGAPLELLEGDLRLTQASTWSRIYGEVESEIAARTSFAGWRVNETELARYYGVSRTVARDVVARLQQRGVVQKDDRSRWIAPAMSPDHVTDLYELRWLLEPVALEKAAPRLPGDLLPGMRQRLEEAARNAGSLTGPDLDHLEEDLHVTLLGHCGNPPLMQAINLPQALLVAHRFLYRWMPSLFGAEPFLPEHLEIVDRLQAGRVTEAADALRRHLQISRERAIDRIQRVTREVHPEDLPYLEKLD